MLTGTPETVTLVPINRIEILNSRDRNMKVFEEIVDNIRAIGLKKPITVAERPGDDGDPRYVLVCGEGRLNAFRILGETHIPALVVDVSDEDAFIMSLAENIARRGYRPLEILADIEVLRKRMAQMVDKVMALTDIQRAHHPVNDCVLVLGGDMVEGLTVFPGQQYEIEAHLFEQLFSVASIIEQCVHTLAGHFRKVHVVCEYGNHGRIGRKGDMPSSDNVDRMAYKIASERCAHLKHVTWQQSADWYQIATIGNYKLLVVHGDEIPSFGGQTPSYSILRKCNAWATFMEFDDAILGHFHTPINLTMANGGRIWVTGSPESDNQYAKSFVAAVGKPSQRLMFVDPDKGRVTCEYVCWLD